MALKIGQKAPNFSIPSTSGKYFELDVTYKDKPLIIYFYPKDFTPVCTKEACEFSDSFEFLKSMDIDVVGISRDTLETHHEFKGAYKIPFELLSDIEGKVAASYDALVPIINFTRRITYLLDKQHNIVAAYENMFTAKKHINEMLKSIKGANVTV